ncbi:MAG: pyridoxal phosphate-dependent decarboxylase family protein [Deltaproteobacteria bacterium]
MTDSNDSLDAARRRIQAAYDPQLVKSAGHVLADLLAGHLEKVQHSESAVLNWADPWYYVAQAATIADSRDKRRRAGDVSPPIRERDSELPARDASLDVLTRRFAELAELSLARGINLHDPRYVGHQVPASVPIAGLFDAIGSVTNQCMAIYEMGPWTTAIEQAMVGKLAEYLGWQGSDFAGIVTHGASLANLTALLVARNVALGESWECGLAADHAISPTPTAGADVFSRGARPAHCTPRLVVQSDAHYCIARSAGILGIGTNNVVKAALDDRRRMDPARLDATLAGLHAAGNPVVAVVACACATPVGAFDPLEQIADVCARHGVWLHVDAAHGGAALLSPRHRHLVAGLERADSLTWDAHKMLFVPALCAFLFYKNKRHSYEAFRQNAPYLFDPSAPGLAEFDSGLRTVECTKRAAAFGLWGVWSMFGPQLFADMVDVTFALGRTFYEKLQAAPDFDALHEPECNIVVFRHVPDELRKAAPEKLGEFQWQLRRAVIESGEFYLVPTTHSGIAALRCTLINPLTTTAHLDQLLETLRHHGRKNLTGG